MVGYIRDDFCEQGRTSPRLGPISSDIAWQDQQRNAERISPEPTKMKAFRFDQPDNKNPEMPDFLTSGSVPIVSEAFRQIVLSLEPDKHQFMPIALFDEARQPLPGTYWVMNVLQRPACVIEPEQIMKWYDEGHSLPEMKEFWRTRPNGARAPSAKVVYIDRSQIEGLHLWRPLWRLKTMNDVRLDLFFSDELLRRVAHAKLRKLTARPAVAISVPS